MNATIVARYNFSDQAAESALLRTSVEGVRHVVEYDGTTDTYVVVRDDDPTPAYRLAVSDR